MEQTLANYNLAIAVLGNLLDSSHKIGSKEDIEIMRLGRFIEDFEVSRQGQAFEPYYVEIQNG